MHVLYVDLYVYMHMCVHECVHGHVGAYVWGCVHVHLCIHLYTCVWLIGFPIETALTLGSQTSQETEVWADLAFLFQKEGCWGLSQGPMWESPWVRLLQLLCDGRKPGLTSKIPQPPGSLLSQCAWAFITGGL